MVQKWVRPIKNGVFSAEGGHYTAESKRNQKWFRIDDNKVTEIKINEVLHTDNRRTPYLLLRIHKLNKTNQNFSVF